MSGANMSEHGRRMREDALPIPPSSTPWMEISNSLLEWRLQQFTP